MKLVRYNGELWTTGNYLQYHVALHSLRGSRFDIAPANMVELVGNNYKPTAADTMGPASSVHDTKGGCRK